MECEGKKELEQEREGQENSGADALMGDTRTHAEHDG